MECFKWQHIQFSDGSNPYICKTQKEFDRMRRKYTLQKINEGFWLAEVGKNENLFGNF